jgi:hypothetical protein
MHVHIQVHSATTLPGLSLKSLRGTFGVATVNLSSDVPGKAERHVDGELPNHLSRVLSSIGRKRGDGTRTSELGMVSLWRNKLRS